MMSILALTLVTTRLDMFDQCVLALGRTKLLSGMNAVRLVTIYCLVPIGYWLYELEGAIWGVACSALVNAVAVLYFQGRLGLLDAKRELLALPLFAAGLFFGWLVRLASFR